MEKRTQRGWRPFTPEFKADVVRMHHVEGRSITAIARDLDLTETAVRSWVRQAEIDAGSRDGLTSEERAELDWTAHGVAGCRTMLSTGSEKPRTMRWTALSLTGAPG